MICQKSNFRVTKKSTNTLTIHLKNTKNKMYSSTGLYL